MRIPYYDPWSYYVMRSSFCVYGYFFITSISRNVSTESIMDDDDWITVWMNDSTIRCKMLRISLSLSLSLISKSGNKSCCAAVLLWKWESETKKRNFELGRFFSKFLKGLRQKNGVWDFSQISHSNMCHCVSWYFWYVSFQLFVLSQDTNVYVFYVLRFIFDDISRFFSLRYFESHAEWNI